MGDVSHDDKTCEVCHAKVDELRRGRCWGCYSRWTEARPVGIGAACCICNERRRDNLRMVELLRAWMPMCHNCAAKATVLAPMPQTLDEIRRRLRRDRRAAPRRVGKPDDRVFRRERRGLERRAVGHANGDDMMILDDDDILMIEELSELSPEDMAGSETRIVELLAADEATRPVR